MRPTLFVETAGFLLSSPLFFLDVYVVVRINSCFLGVMPNSILNTIVLSSLNLKV